jgi:5-methylcytosine-specific restriction endonuclease McrA
MTYSQKLRDPQWQKKRLQILERDHWRCVMCHRDDKNLQVHHGVYRKRDPWDYPDYIYQTLCEDCHSERQELTDKAVDALRIAILNTPTDKLIERAQKICDAAMLTIVPENL